jgi:hypothetical protein
MSFLAPVLPDVCKYCVPRFKPFHTCDVEFSFQGDAFIVPYTGSELKNLKPTYL